MLTHTCIRMYKVRTEYHISYPISIFLTQRGHETCCSFHSRVSITAFAAALARLLRPEVLMEPLTSTTITRSFH